MNKLSLHFVMLGLGAVMYTSIDARIALSHEQFTTQVQAEVDIDNSALATSGWKEFYSNEGKFSVFVPDTSVTNLNSQSEDYSINIYYADTKKSSYIVGYVDYKTDLSKLPLSKIYDNFLKEFIGNEAKLLKQQNIQLGKHPGIEVEYQNENQNVIANIRLFLVGKRLYILDISNSQAGDATQFFNSFKLENQIKDNPIKIATYK